MLGLVARRTDVLEALNRRLGGGHACYALVVTDAPALHDAAGDFIARFGAPDVVIANAGVSGDTTAGGLARLDWSVPDGTDGVILELGANDALRGLAPDKAEANLDAMLTRLKARNIAVLLAGMLAPRNNGPEYVAAFDGMYRRLADKHGVALYPFFLEGQAGVPGLGLPDGIHPNRQGVERIVEGIFPAAEKFVRMLAETKGRK